MSNGVCDSGYVYVISNDRNQVKVGITSNLKRRVSAIRCGCPSAVVSFSSERIDNCRAVESKCHSNLEDFASAGEWFNCSVDTAINSVKSAISDIGVAHDADKYEKVKSDDFNANLDMCQYQSAGIESKLYHASHPEIVSVYATHLKKHNAKYYDLFMGKCASSQFIIAAKEIALDALRTYDYDNDYECGKHH